jgi:hypothetical protein
LSSDKTPDFWQAIIEEKWGRRGGDRLATLFHDPSIGTDKTTKLKNIRQHQEILKRLPGAVCW